MIYIARDGVQQGPFSIEQINAMLASGQFRPGDPAWWEGCTEWVTLQQAPGVALPAAAPAGPAPAHKPPRRAIAPGGTFSAKVSPGCIKALRETRPWVLLLAVFGLSGLGLMVANVIYSIADGFSRGLMNGYLLVGSLILPLIMAPLYFYPILKLLKFSGAISRLSRSGAFADLEEALRQQKIFWKFLGILGVVMIVLFGGAVGVFGGFSG